MDFRNDIECIILTVAVDESCKGETLILHMKCKFSTHSKSGVYSVTLKSICAHDTSKTYYNVFNITYDFIIDISKNTQLTLGNKI